MTGRDVVEEIRRRFVETGSPARVPLQRGGSFTANLAQGGVYVDNLGNSPFLPWKAFRETVSLLQRRGGKAPRGDAMGGRLGEPCLPLDSAEGHVAVTVYARHPGEAVFRRITPLACLLVWAGACRHGRGELILAGGE